MATSMLRCYGNLSHNCRKLPRVTAGMDLFLFEGRYSMSTPRNRGTAAAVGQTG